MYPFNVRVYGLLIHNGCVLVSDEQYGDWKMTKFPGGGLEFGEGTIDCVKREFWEETGLMVAETEHFYTTDFFQPSANNSRIQVISIYYIVTIPDLTKLQTKETPFDFSINGPKQAFRWIPINQLSPATLTLPIDQKVAEKISSLYLE